MATIQQIISGINGLDFLAGLGLFMFGMLQTETALRGLIENRVKHNLHEKTKHPIHAVITGTLATALLQSSSLVGLLVLAMVGAQVLVLKNALGVIVGANLGTTFTGWIVATIGFKLDLSNFALPMVAVGSFWLVAVRKQGPVTEFFRFLIGLGLLLFGLEFMKSSINTGDFTLGNMSFPALYLVLGIFITAAIQSSSAAMMIALSALYAEAITLHNAAAFIIGADLGTTSTILLGTVKGSSDKRRVGLGHLIFNIGTDAFAFFALLPLFIVLVGRIEPVDTLIALVAFHTAFNLVGVILVIPFLGLFARFLKHRFKSSHTSLSKHLDPQLAIDVSSALTALNRVIIDLAKRIHRFNSHALGGNFSQNDQKSRSDYKKVKAIEGELLQFTLAIQQQRLTEYELKKLEALIQAIRNLVHSAKSMKDCASDLADLRYSLSNTEQAVFQSIKATLEPCFDKSLALINRSDRTLIFEELAEIKSSHQSDHDELHKLFIKYFQNGSISWPTISTILNCNRELFIANTDFVEALSLIYLNRSRYDDLNRMPTRS